MNNEEKLKTFLLDKTTSDGSMGELGYDENLYTLGILDSLAFIQLIRFLEEEFGVAVGDGEVIPKNFETINNIVGFLEKKQDAS
ncbi:acyl carrier protein [Candidatus Nitronereus thalassa]|uniref:Phosphopantetheine-binding protein n=1 Tax=Candidatus Nitronereus thalassa TaxID=3020898 RepID=A0ABU3K584_9BACT|nr:phosphopantetheine-binding protein [Candidatus Nitronereus thalassa]MDT7041546.1 phosphopantetheine-binding protein [Candidatus Nitronereus thalassa]